MIAALATRLLGSRWRSLLLYGVVGGVSALLILGITFSATEGAGLEPEVSNGIALVAALLFNFWASRHVIFGATHHHWGRQMLRFVMVSGGARLVEWGLFALLVDRVGIPYMLLAVLILGASFFVKYALYRHIVFRRVVA
ncbi:GtrA family protein [Parapedomonas caeni]